MNSAYTILLAICLFMEMFAYLVPVISKLSTKNLILERIRNSHKAWNVNITHRPECHIFMPLLLKLTSCGLAVIEKRYRSKYRG